MRKRKPHAIYLIITRHYSVNIKHKYVFLKGKMPYISNVDFVRLKLNKLYAQEKLTVTYFEALESFCNHAVFS